MYCTYCKKENLEAKKITITELHEFTPDGPDNQHNVSMVFYACDSCLNKKGIIPNRENKKIHEMTEKERGDIEVCFASQEELDQLRPFVKQVLDAIAAVGYSANGFFSDETLMEEFFETVDPELAMTNLAKCLGVSFKETDYLAEVARRLAAKENKLN